jgi:hypothetical protein
LINRQQANVLMSRNSDGHPELILARLRQNNKALLGLHDAASKASSRRNGALLPLHGMYDHPFVLRNCCVRELQVFVAPRPSAGALYTPPEDKVEATPSIKTFNSRGSIVIDEVKVKEEIEEVMTAGNIQWATPGAREDGHKFVCDASVPVRPDVLVRSVVTCEIPSARNLGFANGGMQSLLQPQINSLSELETKNARASPGIEEQQFTDVPVEMLDYDSIGKNTDPAEVEKILGVLSSRKVDYNPSLVRFVEERLRQLLPQREADSIIAGSGWVRQNPDTDEWDYTQSSDWNTIK